MDSFMVPCVTNEGFFKVDENFLWLLSFISPHLLERFPGFKGEFRDFRVRVFDMNGHYK